VLTSLVPRPFAHSLAARERDALCDLVSSLGAGEPTRCDGWTVKDLVIHLLVRERRPWRPGRAAGELAERDLDSLVTQLRSVPLPLAVVDPLLNGMEMFIHHEDVRRAQSSWTVRPLSDADERSLWRTLTTVGRLQARRTGVPLVVASGERRAVLRRGGSPVVVSGPVSEIVLFLCGRPATEGLSYDGPEDRVAQVRAAELAI
jgi:uncharacterized protein (TIGR03085 family)